MIVRVRLQAKSQAKPERKGARAATHMSPVVSSFHIPYCPSYAVPFGASIPGYSSAWPRQLAM
jgi:hypothetical protein